MSISKKLAKSLLVVNSPAVGERIAARRRELNMTQVEIAKRLRISQAEISVVEKGEKKSIPLEEYSDVLEVPPEYLLTGRK